LLTESSPIQIILLHLERKYNQKNVPRAVKRDKTSFWSVFTLRKRLAGNHISLPPLFTIEKYFIFLYFNECTLTKSITNGSVKNIVHYELVINLPVSCIRRLQDQLILEFYHFKSQTVTICHVLSWFRHVYCFYKMIIYVVPYHSIYLIYKIIVILPCFNYLRFL
jgi:hypothetical protein